MATKFAFAIDLRVAPGFESATQQPPAASRTASGAWMRKNQDVAEMKVAAAAGDYLESQEFPWKNRVPTDLVVFENVEINFVSTRQDQLFWLER